MSLYGALDKTKHLSEFDEPLQGTKEGTLTAATRRERALQNLTGLSTLTVAEIQALNGVTAGTGAAEKALVLDANGDVAVPGEVTLDGNILETEAGTGITGGTGTIYRSSVVKRGGVIKTEILIDLTGLRSTAAGDIIGVDGTSNPCHIGQITAARTGTILAGQVTCLEAPTGGDPDINIYSAAEATGVEDAAITSLTETQLVNTGDHTLGSVNVLTAEPAADEYLYLVAGATTDADYTAGKLLIELWGYDA